MSYKSEKISNDLRTIEFFDLILGANPKSTEDKAIYINKLLTLIEKGLSYDLGRVVPGYNPLVLVTRALLPYGSEQLIEAMLKNGAHPNIIADEILLLLSALYKPSIAKSILEFSSNLDKELLAEEFIENACYTPLDQVKTLFDLVPSLADYKDKDGYTLMHHFSIQNNIELIDELLKIGLSLNIADAMNFYPLDYLEPQKYYSKYSFEKIKDFFTKIVALNTNGVEWVQFRLYTYLNEQLSKINNDEVKYQNTLKNKCELLDIFDPCIAPSCYQELAQRPDLKNSKVFKEIKIKELINNGDLDLKNQHYSSNPAIQSLLKNTYSKIDTEESLGIILEGLYNKHPILKQVLDAAAKHSYVPTFLVGNLNEEFDFKIKAVGYYSHGHGPNLVVSSNCYRFDNRNCKKTLIHELSHMIIDKTFNNWALPYYHSLSKFSYFYSLFGYKEANKDVYETAALETLKNIADHLGLQPGEYNYYSTHHALGKYLWDNYCASSNAANNLNCYYKGYNLILNSYWEEPYPNDIDHNYELIVRLPQSLAYFDDLDNPTIHAMKPLQDYWETYITPKLYAA